MSPWRGGRLPHLSFVPRKPEPLGVELKTLCDSTTGVMLFLEICEGKERMPLKKFEDTYTHTVATTLRLTEPYANTGRAVYGDSWFASVPTTVAVMKEHSNHYFGDVKTAHRGYRARRSRARRPRRACSSRTSRRKIGSSSSRSATARARAASACSSRRAAPRWRASACPMSTPRTRPAGCGLAATARTCTLWARRRPWSSTSAPWGSRASTRTTAAASTTTRWRSASAARRGRRVLR
mmetsp:Transcript_36692/g.86170  ORF Transcript_36692/g.86170 Transcript_36692/m.86170 type:complete len:238 (+) Transcript_36692:989-1702(+)